MTQERQRAELQARIGHSFRDAGLLLRALTHRSFSADNNERLEFLGDALISVVIAEVLFQKQPRAGEGALSRLRSSLVRERSLAQIARRLDLGSLLQLGEGELKSGGWRRDSVLADALEALVASVYLDAGFDAVRIVSLRLFEPELAALPDAETLKDPKTRLQEWLQARGRPVPEYLVLSETGPAHHRHFHVRARLQDADHSSDASGSSRRTAEQMAADVLLRQLGDDA